MLLETFSFSYELDNTLKLSREVKTKYKENIFLRGTYCRKTNDKGSISFYSLIRMFHI